MRLLKAYVKRTIIESAREYADGKRRTAESTERAFRDATRGTDTGWWTDLVYTTDTLRIAYRYRKDIATIVREFCSECGIEFGDTCDSDGEVTWGEVLAATSRRWTWDDYTGTNGPLNKTGAKAAELGIRFAVDYLCGIVASEMGVGV